MTPTKPYAGLMLPDASSLDPKPFLKAAYAALKHVMPSGYCFRIVPEHGIAHNNRLAVQVTVEEFSDYGPKVSLVVHSLFPSSTNASLSVQVLSKAVQLCLQVSESDIVEWEEEGALISAEDFLLLQGFAQPVLDDAESTPFLQAS